MKTPRDIAKKLLDANDWDLNKARMQLTHELHEPYIAEVAETLLLRALQQALSDLWVQQRAFVTHRVPYVLQKGEVSKPGLIQQALQDRAEAILGFPISAENGIVLGEARRADLDVWIATNEKQWRTMGTNIVWIKDIRKRLTNGSVKVKNALSTEQLDAMRDAAEKSVADADAVPV